MLCCGFYTKRLPFAKKAICFFYYPQCKLLYLYGYLEESGHLFFVDRLKRMVKISRMNVFPNEIEKNAYVISAVHEEIPKTTLESYEANQKQPPRSNPDNKSIMNKYQKEVDLSDINNVLVKSLILLFLIVL